jgi:uncharacterized membrane protein YsdA (DUF1294 family)
MRWALAVYLGLSLITFAVYAWDKSSARRGGWRVSEAKLHILSLVGGWPGALCAQQVLRHKSSKQPFRRVFWTTVFINLIALLYLSNAGLP